MDRKRRTLLKAACYASGLSCLTPAQAYAAIAMREEDIHLHIANLARELNKSDVSLKLLLPNGSESNVKPVIDQFTQLTGTKIILLPVPVDDINTEMQLSHSAGESLYDIALPTTFGIPDLAEAGVISDLSSLQQQYEPENFQSSALYTVGDYYRNRFYGYQVDGDVYLTFYNQQLVTDNERKRFAEELGYEYRKPATWEELDQQMAYFHRPEENQYGGLLFRNPGYIAWEFWMRLHAQGGLPLAADLTPQLASDEGIKALESMIKASAFLHPNAKTNGLFDNWKDYTKGNVYANIGWGGSQKYFQRQAPNLSTHIVASSALGMQHADGVIPLSYFNWGWNYTVSSQSKHQDLAYLYTLFAVSPQPSIQSVQAADGFFDPYRQEHYEDPQIQKTYTTAFLEEHKNALAHCVPDFYIQGQSLYFSELKKYLMLALDGQMSAAQALQTVDKRWLLLHQKFDQNKLQEQWDSLLTRYPKDFLNLIKHQGNQAL